MYQKDHFRIEALEDSELRALMKPLMGEVYNTYPTFSTEGLNWNSQELDSNRSSLYTLNLGLFHKDEFIGWSNGIQTSDNRYYMKNSGVLPKFRSQGLYTELLKVVIEETKKQGFLELYSNHHTDNNAVIIAKLKQGFFITGMEVLPKYGLTVQLSYSHSPKLKDMHSYRIGRALSPDIKDRLK